MMITSPSLVKKLTVMAMVVVGVFMATNIFGQDINFKYKIDSVMTGANMQYNVVVTMTEGTGPFNFSLYEGIPWNNGTLLQIAEDVNNSVYTFRDLQRKKLYMLVVQLKNNDEVITRKSFKIQ